MAEGLSPRQRETLEWIIEFIKTYRMPPTVREIGKRFDIASSSVFEMLRILEKKGYIRRNPSFGTRSLEVIEIPPGLDMPPELDVVDVPILGKIAAGKPILACEYLEGTLPVSRKLVKQHPTFALKVQGDSMIEAGIFEGDYVIVRQQPAADNGEIVVALIEDEATVKRYYREPGRIRLQPENKNMQPIYIESGEFRILGKVIGLHRSFEK